ncbi:MAG: dethiobiotin synthase [Rhodocyclaceae bacterium]|nr:dethiobiotin synthase [Rhodocyclaceae bacterium]
MESSYFITATATDAGKTFVAEGLARVWRAHGRRVRALKPVMSGYDAAAAEQSDAGRLLAACGYAATPENIAAISPWRFAAPLSPDRAAAAEGRALDFDDLVAWCRREVLRSEGAALVEGIGGVMVPLDANHTVRDWIVALDLPVLLVAGTYLGAISDALCALAALREVDVRPVALVLNESIGGVSLDDTQASLAPHLDGIAMFALGRDDAAGLERLAASLGAPPR